MTLTRDEIRELCDAAEIAWEKAGRRARLARFKHKGQVYVSTLTSFRLLVQNARGEPLCCRYF